MELIDKQVSSVAAYEPLYAELVKLEEDNSKLTFDYASKAGNKDARSHIYKLRQSKGALERTRKEQKAESLRIGKAIDSEAAAIEARIEAMIVVHQKEIDKIEKAEADRVALIKGCMENIADHGASAEFAIDLQVAISTLEVTKIGDDFAEFKAEALALKDSTLQALRVKLTAMQKVEAEAAELARLREEAAARQKADHEAAIAKAAEDRARAEAEAKAAQVAAAATKAQQDAENKAKADREAAERRELELKLAAETAERRRVEAEQKAEQDRQDAAAKAEQDRNEAAARAERQAAEAVEAEKRRVAAEAKAEADAQAQREANKAHKARINNAALKALVAGGMTEECAKTCVTLIASGKVPAVTISY